MSHNPPAFLSPEDALKIDSALMSQRDKFSTRVAIYALGILRHIAPVISPESAQPSGNPEAIDPSLGRLLTTAEIRDWLARSEESKALIQDQGMEWDEHFLNFWTQLIDSAQRSLGTIAAHYQVPGLDLSVDQIVAWFEAQAKAAVEATKQS